MGEVKTELNERDALDSRTAFRPRFKAGWFVERPHHWFDRFNRVFKSRVLSGQHHPLQ